MVYFDMHPVGQLIREFFELHKGPDYYDEMQAVNAWKEVVGPFIASHTLSLNITNHVLLVRVDSDVLRNELGYSKSVIINRLNESVGKQVVEDIVLS